MESHLKQLEIIQDSLLKQCRKLRFNDQELLDIAQVLADKGITLLIIIIHSSSL